MPDAQEYLARPWAVLHPLEPYARGSLVVVSDEATAEFQQMASVLSEEIERLFIKMRDAPTDQEVISWYQACIARHADILCVIAAHKKLPAEVLGIIFEYARVHGVNVPPERPEREYPWNLGQVCSKWRRVLLDTPAVWDSVTLRGYDGNRDSSLITYAMHLRTLELTANILRRGTRSLYIHFPDSMEAFPIGDDQLSSLILPFAGQLVALSLHCSSKILLPFFSLSPPLFSSLELLDIKHWDQTTTHSFLKDLRVFSKAPKLHHLSASVSTSPSSLEDLNPQTFHFRWNQLTSFVGRDMLFQSMDVYRLLFLCDNLRTCHLEISNASRTVASPFKKECNIVLTNLHSLELSGAELHGALATFFEPLTLPSLKSLKITANRRQPASLNQEDLMNLLTRSECELESFITSAVQGGVRTDIEPLMSMLSPTLRRLELPSAILPQRVLMAIAAGEMFPKLEHLHFCVFSLTTFDAFAEIVAKRWGYDELSPVSNIWAAGAHSPPWERPVFWSSVQDFCDRYHELHCGQGRNIRAI